MNQTQCTCSDDLQAARAAGGGGGAAALRPAPHTERPRSPAAQLGSGPDPSVPQQRGSSYDSRAAPNHVRCAV